MHLKNTKLSRAVASSGQLGPLPQPVCGNRNRLFWALWLVLGAVLPTSCSGDLAVIRCRNIGRDGPVTCSHAHRPAKIGAWALFKDRELSLDAGEPLPWLGRGLPEKQAGSHCRLLTMQGCKFPDKEQPASEGHQLDVSVVPSVLVCRCCSLHGNAINSALPRCQSRRKMHTLSAQSMANLWQAVME